jgi:N-acetylglucosaminyl-diphospho-decaprenol L-rhamnosyltransferase
VRDAVTADVVIVTWQSGQRVLRCLQSLRTQQPQEHTFVVDNASLDGTLEGVRRRFPATHVLELPENRGFGAAVNAGAALGIGEAIILVNDDVEVAEGFVDAILAPLRENARCGMVAGLTMMPGTDKVDGFGIELDVTLAAYNRLRHGSLGDRPGGLAMPSGGLAAYRRAAFEQVGGFDTRLFAYGEDVDLGLRMRSAGWTAADAHGARGVHEGGASIGLGSRRQRELAGFARGFILRRYGVLSSSAAARALLFESLLVGWGLVAHWTALPLSARIKGWRAANGRRLPVSPETVNRAITAREAFRRLRQSP